MTSDALLGRAASKSGLYLRRSGLPEGPVLVLLHGGLGNGDVWQGVEVVLAERWPGSWLVPDLPGHGRSTRLPHYSYGLMAAQVAQAVTEHVTPGTPVHVLGHSLGGVVGLTLASGWFGIDVSTVCAIGTKPLWTEDEVAMTAAAAAAPAPVFPTRDDAVRFVLAVAAMGDAVDPASPLCDRLVIGDGDQWEPVTDPASLGVGAPDLPGLLAASRAREVLLAAGEHDPLCPPSDLLKTRPAATVLPGAGHYPHVQSPESVWPLLENLLLLA
ncbi:alpha/beta fold hydrolase [Streptomyces fuscichromogenes]|uniref:Alpha/beta hydrolase n=1 Tax=Streptomyces fuscichromogenes TaxID=1324013 RepID=A0A917XFA2_9ACTN|nr:alpha/beta hydrolase [Streptomyces fuscichromogenes]GGN19389.1 alpha/beta hydrolase [Streptomyces fuscichromogenes]